MKFLIDISQNGWEYTGQAMIEADKVEIIGTRRILIDDKIKVTFDEQVNNLRRIDNEIELDDYSYFK